EQDPETDQVERDGGPDDAEAGRQRPPFPLLSGRPRAAHGGQAHAVRTAVVKSNVPPCPAAFVLCRLTHRSRGSDDTESDPPFLCRPGHRFTWLTRHSARRKRRGQRGRIWVPSGVSSTSYPMATSSSRNASARAQPLAARASSRSRAISYASSPT